MVQLRFQLVTRTPAINAFSAEQRAIWDSGGHLIWDVLRHETALTLDDVVVACREYAWECDGAGRELLLDVRHVTWYLLQLCQIGCVRIVLDGVLDECA
jgi:hypothetical protein